MLNLQPDMKIPINPMGPDWAFAYFTKHILSDLFNKKLIKTINNTPCVRPGPFKKWRKSTMGSVLLLDIALVAQQNNFPVMVEENIPYLILNEKIAIIEYIKYTGCHN